MKLKDHVLKSVFDYPILYLCKSYEESRILVLHQDFLVNGNEMEWAMTKNPKNGGYLVHDKYRKKHGDWVRIYDKNYGVEKFEMDWNDLVGHGMSDFLNDNENSYKEMSAGLKQLIQGEKQKEFESSKFFSTETDRAPYPFSSGGWPMKEIFDKTQSLEFLKDDWREGMIDVFSWALKFYQDSVRYKADRYYGIRPEKLKEWVEKPHNDKWNKNWKEILKQYGVADECENLNEFDYLGMDTIRNEKTRKNYINSLTTAILVLQ